MPDHDTRRWHASLKSSRAILDEEIREAEQELERSPRSLLIAGLMAGLAIGVSLFLMGVVLTLAPDDPAAPLTTFLLANAHTIGFIIAILGRTDLFTEYTTLAILPVLEGRASPADLLRFWGWIYGANLLGGAAFALLTLVLGPALGVIDAGRLAATAHELTGHAWWVMLLSAVLAGWLMGLLAWLVTSSRDTIGQIFFIWLIVFFISIASLHHSISGFVVVFFGWIEGAIAVGAIGRFVLWVTFGNALGGVAFAVLTRLRAPVDAR